MAYDQQLADAVREIEQLKADLADLRNRATAVAEEYEREERQLSSSAVAGMLREWVGEYR